MPDLFVHNPATRTATGTRRWSGHLFCLFLLAGLWGCASHPRQPPSQLHARPAAVQEIHPVVAAALEQLDSPYRYGGTTPGGFDCSGLVFYAYQHSGIPIPRTAAEQRRQARPVAREALAPGDLLFFRQRKRSASHVGLYVGNGRFIHASTSERAVKLSWLTDPYWQQHLVAIGRYGE